MLKMDDLRGMKTEDLVKKSTEIRDELAEMKRRVHMGEMQNTSAVRMKRRDLARTMTVLSEQFAKEKA